MNFLKHEVLTYEAKLKADQTSSNFIKAFLHKFNLVHSWILCPISSFKVYLLIMHLFILILYQSMNDWKLAKMTGCFTRLYIHIVEDYILLLLQLLVLLHWWILFQSQKSVENFNIFHGMTFIKKKIVFCCINSKWISATAKTFEIWVNAGISLHIK